MSEQEAEKICTVRASAKRPPASGKRPHSKGEKMGTVKAKNWNSKGKKLEQ